MKKALPAVLLVVGVVLAGHGRANASSTTTLLDDASWGVRLVTWGPTQAVRTYQPAPAGTYEVALTTRDSYAERSVIDWQHNERVRVSLRCADGSRVVAGETRDLADGVDHAEDRYRWVLDVGCVTTAVVIDHLGVNVDSLDVTAPLVRVTPAEAPAPVVTVPEVVSDPVVTVPEVVSDPVVTVPEVPEEPEVPDPVVTVPEVPEEPEAPAPVVTVPEVPEEPEVPDPVVTVPEVPELGVPVVLEPEVPEIRVTLPPVVVFPTPAPAVEAPTFVADLDPILPVTPPAGPETTGTTRPPTGPLPVTGTNPLHLALPGLLLVAVGAVVRRAAPPIS
jgi:hypothetical protein